MKTGKKTGAVHTPLIVQNLAKYGKKAGDPLFQLVADWLRSAHHYGNIGPTSCSSIGLLNAEDEGPYKTRNALINRFLIAVVMGDHAIIRRFAASVKRVHERRGDGSDPFNDSLPFYIPSLNPALARLARNTVGTTLPTKAREITKTLLDLGGPQISERTARRRRKELGLKPGKPGRPRKAQK